MPKLPGNPDLDQLRRQAKELVRAARRGETGALERIGSVSGEVTLAAAQVAIAREYGMVSWPALRLARYVIALARRPPARQRPPRRGGHQAAPSRRPLRHRTTRLRRGCPRRSLAPDG